MPPAKGKKKQKGVSPSPAFVPKFKPGGGTVMVKASPERDGDVGSPLTDIVDEEGEEESEADAGVRLDPDDSMYHGKSTRNRVATPPPLIIKTRSRRAKVVSSPESATVEVSVRQSERRSKHTHSKTSIVLSGDENTAVAATKSKSKRAKVTPEDRAATPVVDEDDIDVDMDAEYSQPVRAQPRDAGVGIDANMGGILDLEAEVSGDDQDQGSLEGEDECSPGDKIVGDISASTRERLELSTDRYDLADDFINDASELSVYDSDDEDGARGRARSTGSNSDPNAGSDEDCTMPAPSQLKTGKKNHIVARAQPKPLASSTVVHSEESDDDDIPLSTLKARATTKGALKDASSSLPGAPHTPRKTKFGDVLVPTSKSKFKTPASALASTKAIAADSTPLVGGRNIKSKSTSRVKDTLDTPPYVAANVAAVAKTEPVSDAEYPEVPTPGRPKPKPTPKPITKSVKTNVAAGDKASLKPKKTVKSSRVPVSGSNKESKSPSRKTQTVVGNTSPVKTPSSVLPSKGKTPATVVVASPAKHLFTVEVASAAWSGSTGGKREVPLEELKWLRVYNLPDTCQVNDAALQDPRLAHIYADAPKLKAGLIHGWSDAEGDGMMPFSSWPQFCSYLDLDSCMSIMEFVKWANYCNLVLLSPCDVYAKEIIGQNRFHMYTADHHPVMCLSAMRLTESYLFSFPDSNYQHKRVAGVFHCQDWERIVAFICMVFHQDDLFAQIYRDALQISTRVLESKPSTSSPYKKRPGAVAGIRSPAIASSKSKSQFASHPEPYTLGAEEDVPVYDCRNVKVDFTTDLDKLKSFPLWEGREIPEDSFVVIAYTVHMYHSKTKGWSVSFNLHWVMVLGTPEDEN